MHLPAVVQQRRAVAVVFALLDAADEDLMVALAEMLEIAAFEDRHATLQQGHTVARVVVLGMREPVRALRANSSASGFCVAASTWTA